MKNKGIMRRTTTEGFIGILIMIIVSLALLKYFLKWDIFDAASTPEGQGTIGYIRNILNVVWSYISTPVVFLWDRILWPILSLAWNNFQNFIEWGRSI